MHDESPASSLRPPAPAGCPECSAPIAGAYERCPRCALPLRGPVAAELWRLDGALAGLRAREAELLLRRGHLLDLLGRERAEREARQERPEPARPADTEADTGGGPAVPEPAGRPGAVPEPEPGKDFSPRAVQNLLLGLGGLLLVVAAVVFTVVSWGSMGLGGRAAILAAVTGLTFAAPVLLVRRGLVTTAETITMLGAALLFLDGYAARRTGLVGADGLAGPHYAALLFALVALAMAGCSRLLPLRLPLPVAIVLAQFPLPLLALGETAPWLTAALAATAAADAALLVFRMAARSPGPGSGPGETPGGRGPLTTVAVCFGVVWGLGVCHGLLEAILRRTPSDVPATASLGEGLLLVALAVIGLAVARRVRDWGRLSAVTVVSALALTVGVAALIWPLTPHTWWAVPYTVAALVTVAVMLYAPGLDEPRVRSTGAASAGALAAVTALPFANEVIFTLFAPFNRLGDVWSGSPGFADARLIAPFPEFPVVAGLLAVASAVAAARGRAVLGFPALAAGTLATAVAPVAFGWGHGVDLAVLSALAVVLVAAVVLAGRPRWARALAVAAGAVSTLAAVTALAERSSTYATLGVLLVAWGAAAFAARVREEAAVSLVACVLSATGLVWAVSAGTRWLPAGDGLALSLAAGAVLAALLALRGGPPAMPSPSREKPVAAPSPSLLPEKPVAAPSPEGAPATPSPEGVPASSSGGGDPRRLAGLVLSAVLTVLALVSAHAAVSAVLGFHRPLVRPWTAVAGPAGGHPLLVALVGLVAVAAVLVSWQVARRRGATRAVLLAWPALLVALPVSAALPYGVELGLFVAGTVPTAWVAARSRANAVFGGVAALWTAFVAVSWALMSEPATLAVLPAVALIAVAVVLGDRAGARGGGEAAAPVAPGGRGGER
ncbi:hypothetical protein, partial [Streptosporangium sp. NPDC048865]|uniref:hypothetical protein n=1 Tax=Streptosporangium sp. NPDC048865 TaxID=3155766 RepID=UPI00341D8891